MAAYIVWTCPANGTHVGDFGSMPPSEHPRCPTGTGKFVAIEQHPEFDVSSLNAGDLGQAFAAGFVVVGIACVIAIPMRAIVNAVRDLF